MVPSQGTRRAMPLAARLAAVLTVASFFVALLVAFLTGERDARDRTAERDANMASFANELAERAGPMLERGDVMRLSILAAAGRDMTNGRIIVIDGGGKVRIDTSLVLGDRQLGLLALGGPFQRFLEYSGDVPTREALVPVRLGGEVIGELRLQHAAGPVLAGFPFGLFAIVFLCCLSLVAVAVVVGHHWLAQVRRATQALVNLASGEVGQTAATDAPMPPTEIGDLNHALAELDRGMQEGLSRVAEGFVNLARQLVDGLERRGLAPLGHGERTARYAGILAARLGLLPQDRKELEMACRLHDLGKAWLRPSILEKQEPLDEAERESLWQHPVRAAAHLESMPSLRRVAQIVRHQHERHGGSGHPDGLRGDRIPLGARILAIASTYDLLTVCAASGRPLEWQPALDRLVRDRGEVFDPWLLDLFSQEIRKSPEPHADRAVMISPAGVVALRSAVGTVEGRGEDAEGDLDYDLAEELEVMLDEQREDQA